MASQRFKVVILGEGRVGKTSILLRYVRGEYSDKQQSTLQASYLDKKVSAGGQTANLSIWDTAGQERFHALGPIYYRDADGALLVYDITDFESFTKVRKWVRELRSIVGNDIDIVIAGNKFDLEKNRAVPEADALQYAETVGATHIYTSAKQNKGLDETFAELAKRMVSRRSSGGGAGAKGAAAGGAARGRPASNVLQFVENEPAPKSKSSCC
uniref:Ras-related protein Rab-21 n=1 Tax=Rhizochromulina marina TaxID=1034831 RepID=A0A7S2R7Q4_9STRA|mmetsp:Transcript_12277/g.35480  ORF Transcript_12277/g.35480 Transcript_12277/m.35480 type:complete len:213 (+) Transcript_12277:152-790(+)